MKIKIKSREECFVLGNEFFIANCSPNEIVSGDPLMYLPSDVFGTEKRVLSVYHEGSINVYEVYDDCEGSWIVPAIFVEKVIHEDGDVGVGV